METFSKIISEKQMQSLEKSKTNKADDYYEIGIRMLNLSCASFHCYEKLFASLFK